MEKTMVKKYQLPWGGTLTVVAPATAIRDLREPPCAPPTRKPIEFKEEPEKKHAGKWINLYFLKCGKSLTGTYLYDTEGEAIASAQEKIKSANKMISMGRNPCMMRGTKRLGHLWRELSHVVQMPAAKFELKS